MASASISVEERYLVFIRAGPVNGNDGADVNTSGVVAGETAAAGDEEVIVVGGEEMRGGAREEGATEAVG